MKALRPIGDGELTPDRIRELDQHFLAAGFNKEEREDAIWAIEIHLPIAAKQGRSDPKERDREVEHLEAIAQHGSALRNALNLQRPLPEIPNPGINWERFDRDLEHIIKIASNVAQALRPAPKRGRRSEEWRDGLIALVRDRYGDLEKRGRMAHFERTIEIVLGYVGAVPDDVRSTVRQALKRNPRPPFTFHRS